MPEPVIVPLVTPNFVTQPVAVSSLPHGFSGVPLTVADAAPGLLKTLLFYAKHGGAWHYLGDATAPRSSPHPVGIAAVADANVAPATFTVAVSGTVAASETRTKSVACRIAPVLLASSLDPVDTVLVVKSALTEKFVAELSRLLPNCDGKPRVQTIDGSAVPHDVWMQDSTEIAVCAVPKGRGVTQTPVPLGGLRALHDGIKTAPLDQSVRDFFARDPKYVPIQGAEPRPKTRWIDWFGNLEVSPPVPRFPHGRVLTGWQKELRMHPDLVAFLERQRLQVPPLFLDVSWLTIGHVDELINFVPAKDGKGYRALLPAPGLAKSVLEAAAKSGHAAAPVFAGTREETTVAELLAEVADSAETRAIEASLKETRQQLLAELSLDADDIVDVPVLFRNGLPVIPNAVNSLVVGRDLILPAPLGAKVAGKDIFEQSLRERLSPLGVRLHFVDIWEPYHTRSGEVHCGTNAVRRLKNPHWWKGKT